MVVLCRVCGADHASCGPVSTAIPIDPDNAVMRGRNAMPELKIYTYVLNGNVVTVKLSPEDAKLLGAKEVKPKPATVIAHAPAVPVAGKSQPEVPNAARSAPSNKGR